jgi:YesN/AraC family two-component response regulator
VPRTSAIREVVQYVDDNFLERITLDELAFLFGTNRATLCKEFKGATGKTVVNYISDKKLYITHIEVTGNYYQGGFVDMTQPDGSVVTKWIGG